VSASKDTQLTASIYEVTPNQMQSKKIGEGNKLKMGANTRDSREKRVATILTAITVVYVIFLAPRILYNSITRILSITQEIPRLKGSTLMGKLFNWLAICNSMVNPIIYTFFNGQFISTFYEMKKKIFSFFQFNSKLCENVDSSQD